MKYGIVIMAVMVLTQQASLVAAQPLQPGQTFTDCKNCPELVVAPSGTFIMGSTPEETTREGTPDRDAGNEKPQHRVTIAKPFAVMKYEVTRGDFAKFVAATGHKTADGCKVWDRAKNDWGIMDADASWRNPGFPQTDRDPVVCVQWADAVAYAAWLSVQAKHTYRLLTDAEFEWLLRANTTAAGTSSVRWWGDGREQACDYANVSDLTKAAALKISADPATTFQCKDGYVFTAPVGSFKPNPFGIHDLFGNAWEWVQDCFARTYDGAPSDGSAREDGDCSERVIRGGAWHADPWYIRSAKHDWAPPELNTARVGFRLARSLRE
ncbi:MAG: formylglycine-generating enzyme family protein [Rhodospirillaceae bacterium]|nr:formylglycine-generating enzyme family protein [Rhodospirillaceae bacterium]